MPRISRLWSPMRKLRQKRSIHDDRCSTSIPSPNGSNAASIPTPGPRPLKGRKKFSADLDELKAHPELIPQLGQWSVKSVQSGDEEATLEIILVNATEVKAQTITLLVSDSSLYPDEHTYFGYSQDAGALESDVARVIDKLPTQTGCTLREIVEFFVEGMSRGDDCQGSDGSEEDDDDQVDLMMLDEDYEQFSHSGPSQTTRLSLGHLMKDFVDVKDAGYNPGILWTGSNEFILSVSLPVVDLFQRILPHALLAWDRHFLEPGLHLTLLISGFNGVYPVLQQDGTHTQNYLRTGSTLKYKVGFTQNYKPSGNNAAGAFREFFLRDMDKDKKEDANDATSGSDMLDLASDPDPGMFRRMSLSTPLESLLDQQLFRLLQLRRRFSLGWAGAEELLWQSEIAQADPATVLQQKKKEIKIAESDEKQLFDSNILPSDPVGTSGSDMNILKIAFVFLLRRLALSTQHCVVCHKKLPTHDALRPYVCSSGLCVFQYYSLNLGPSIEHEIITNTGGVDLLVSLAYVAAVEGVLDEPLPRGMGLRVRRPANADISVDDDGLCELDSLILGDMRKATAELLSSLPPIKEMKEYLQRQSSAGNTRARVKDMDPDVLPAAWSALRWCVASCTAHVQELTEPEDRLSNLDKYRQFRFLVGAPDREKKFLNALPEGDHPAVFAFHGSPLRNWHSIIRHGLWVKGALHGRSHGNGVYFCQDASVSLTSYAQRSSTLWKNSTIKPTSCCTLAEIVNRRRQFVYDSPPYFVVDKTEWIMCRYLLVQTAPEVKHCEVNPSPLTDLQFIVNERPAEEKKVGKYLKQERNLCTRLGLTTVDVPQPSYQIDKLVKACVLGRKEITLEDEDRAILDGPKEEPSGPGENPSSSRDIADIEYGTHGIFDGTRVERDTKATADTPPRPIRVWKPDDKWIEQNATELLSPPTESSVTASVALKREFRSMMREQIMAIERGDLATLGWYLPPQHNENNLYQWLVELHSFDPELPIAKDMTSKGVASIAMEIRFPPSFPHAPPFFRVIRPRFRPFVQGGGGHVTIGGSICMDLLTSDGWLPSYCVSAVLLQIKLAMASTTPYPARLQNDWDRPYTPEEALRGYIRAANFHNWKIKNEQEIQRLVTAK
ncbi:hypothetical protein EV363DRAFT_1432403 [Boletus edulis]|nr:hypothetical protein EV363DRAFT_1432403 [Boletus edulis]